jgi:hypothetical protein
MSADERNLRYARYLLWVLMLLNMLGLYFLRHPEGTRASAAASTSFALQQPVPGTPVAFSA